MNPLAVYREFPRLRTRCSVALIVMLAMFACALCGACATRSSHLPHIELRMSRRVIDEWDVRLEDTTLVSTPDTRTGAPNTPPERVFRVTFSDGGTVYGCRREKFRTRSRYLVAEITPEEHGALVSQLRKAGVEELLDAAFYRSRDESTHADSAYVRLILDEGVRECWVSYYLPDQAIGPRRAVIDVLLAFGESLMDAHPDEARREEYEEEGDDVPAVEVSFGDLARSGGRWNGRRVAVSGHHVNRTLYDNISNRTERIEIMWASSFSKQVDILNVIEGYEGSVRIEGVYDSNPEGDLVLKRVTRMDPLADD